MLLPLLLDVVLDDDDDDDDDDDIDDVFSKGASSLLLFGIVSSNIVIGPSLGGTAFDIILELCWKTVGGDNGL